MGFFATFADKILGIDPPKPPPPLRIKQKQIVEVVVVGPRIEQAVAVGPKIQQIVAPGPSVDAESIRILANALVASQAVRSQGQVQLIGQLFSKSRAAQASNGRQADKVLQPAIRQISGESSETGMAIALGFLLVLAALTLSKRRAA